MNFKHLLWIFALSISTTLPAHAAHRLQPVITGYGDIQNTPVGQQIHIRCQLLNGEGQEVFRGTDGQTPAKDLMELALVRSPTNGFDGNLSNSTGNGTVTEPGVYVFECTSKNDQLLPSHSRQVASMAARLRPIESGSIMLQNTVSETPRSVFEINQPMRISVKAYRDTAHLSAVKPSNIQITFRSGRQTCQSGGEMANAHFHFNKRDEWNANKGTTYHYTPKRKGHYSLIVSQLSKADGSALCESIPIKVMKDAQAPIITLTRPNAVQMKTSRSTIRVEGKVIETGSSLKEVIVSNGHWQQPAHIIKQGNGTYRFSTDLPFETGLSVITATARDKRGLKSMATKGITAGNAFSPIIHNSDAFMGNREIQLAIGRSLLIDRQAPIDSLEEIVAIAPDLLKALGFEVTLPSSSVSEHWRGDIFPKSIFAFYLDVDFDGQVTPGEISYQIWPSDNRLNLTLRIPLSGNITVDPEIGFDGSVKISGVVDLILPLALTDLGGQAVVLNMDEVHVNNRLTLKIDSSGAGTIKNELPKRVNDQVIQQFTDLITERMGCLTDQGKPKFCQPPEPFETQSREKGAPEQIRLSLAQWAPFDHTLPLSFEIPYLKKTPVSLNFGVKGALLGFKHSRLQANLNAFPRANEIDSRLARQQYLVQHSGDRTPQEPVANALNLPRLFGSGNQDIQGGIHINAINEALAQLWASHQFEIDMPFVDLLIDAGFFEDSGQVTLARAALGTAPIRINLLAPPRLTYYSQTNGLYAEIGPIQAELDLQEMYESQLMFEGGLVTKVDISPATNKKGIAIRLTDPTACTPNARQFMNCKGLFRIGMTQREGLTHFNKRPPFMNEASMMQLLSTLGVVNENGRYLSDYALNQHFQTLIGSAIAPVLKKTYRISLPSIDLPDIDIGTLQLQDLEFSGLNIPNRAKGDGLSRGWIGFEVDLGARKD